jgi:hypothetical protein
METRHLYSHRPSICSVDLVTRAGIFKKTMGARHRVGIGLSYRPARLHRLAELMPWHRFLVSIRVLKYQLCITEMRVGGRSELYTEEGVLKKISLAGLA